MVVFVILVVLLASIQPISFLMYNWKKKNKPAAIGMLFLILAAICIPILAVILR